MKNIQIDECVGKLCGWTSSKNNEVWRSLDRKQHQNGPPCYTTKLDACVEFEHKLSEIELTEYAVQLRRIVTRNVERNNEPKHPDTLRIPDGRYYCALPIERCEAFLNLKGLWNESYEIPPTPTMAQ